MVENNKVTLSESDVLRLLEPRKKVDRFVEQKFAGLYFLDEENKLIDLIRANIKNLRNPYKRAIAMSALMRACFKKRPRGVFTYTGHRYDDGRKDLLLSFHEQFVSAVGAINAAVFDNGKKNKARNIDAMEFRSKEKGLVYIDPPYYSPFSDNEYVRRYHFVEGLARDWQGVEIQEHTATKKFRSYPTPFSSRKGAAEAFDQLFKHFKDSVLLVSYSSNSQPTKDEMVFIRAVQEASEESLSKDASTYGKLINLIVERQLSQRQEVIDLQEAMKRVLGLFCPDPAHPELQAQEIRDLEGKINDGLREVIGGEARIRTEAPDINALLLPNTSLVMRDQNFGIDTTIGHQGHGLQRTLVMTLLQLLADAQEGAIGTPQNRRPVILIVEEPELYMHPQMERRMRDLLYRLAAQPAFQVACCTHSPVFIDIANRYKAIVRMAKAANGDVSAKQVTQELFVGNANEVDRQVLTAVSKFSPGVNELFFAPEVVLLEELTALAAFERAAELTGLFDRHPMKRRGVAIIDANGKASIPAFQRVLNAFDIPYRVVHDEDRSKPAELARNLGIIAAAGVGPGAHPVHLLSPDSIEDTLNYTPPSKGKPYAAVCRVEELAAQNALPAPFLAALNFVYFGTLTEPNPN